jgi:maltokinase
VIEPAELLPLVAAYLPQQRWYAGDQTPASVALVDYEVVRRLWPGLASAVVDADGHQYQLLIGVRPADEEPEFLHGSDYAVLGPVTTDEGPGLAYDATQDADLALALLTEVTEGREAAEWVRPMTADQSNSSLVYEDRLILKLFRRLHHGPNLDAEVTLALDDVGFNHIAAPLAVWRRADRDLAILQPFLAGGTEGWALALTSIRDLYAARVEPARAGGDFADWAAAMRVQLDRVAARSPWRSTVTAAITRLARARDAGVAIRLHGDYHLGQVMRTDTGWFVLDFEGEPARPVEERRRPSSPLRDVAGMLRSFHYATEVVLHERDEVERSALAPLASGWEQRNRDAFLQGYRDAKGIDELLPEEGEAFDTVLTAFELDKAVYEVGYERDHRPDWIGIPLAAIRRAVGRT